MDSLVIIAILLLGGFAIAASKKAESTSGMEDAPVSLDNIRKGVARGWYSATLCRVNGAPAIHLYGKDASGNNYGDVFPITEADWQTLKNEGYNVAE